MATSTNIYKNAAIAWDGLDLSGHSNNATFDFGATSEVANGFGDTTEINVPLINTVGVGVSGFFDPNTVDVKTNDALGDFTTERVMTLAPLGNTAGNLTYMPLVALIDTTRGGDFGELAKFSLTFNGAGIVGRGTLTDTGSQATAAGTGYELGALSATQTLLAHLHVLSGSTTTVDATVESDTDNTFASAVTRLTMTQVVDTGADRQSATGAITDTWFRFNFTVSGSVTILASLAIVG